MRIISGRFKGRKLKALSGLEVRPTSDRLRETLFNILAPQVRQSRFLDLCAGSGAIGIEAFSRGANEVVFIDHSHRSCQLIKENLTLLGNADAALILQRDALAALKYLEATTSENAFVEQEASDATPRQFDLIYFDPPYASDLYERLLPQLGKSQLLHADSIVVVEHRTSLQLQAQYGHLQRYREVKQGDSALAFYSS
ncbi:MAG: 16S rRNA (guanine(966)-N(2))-methyltransferase RsmD [Acidobacteria bacterium]|nr:16S rRNA (guanine(966)-N(2))-methyltransferase RsmD [Acidobacteriota bacterium]